MRNVKSNINSYRKKVASYGYSVNIMDGPQIFVVSADEKQNKKNDGKHQYIPMTGKQIRKSNGGQGSREMSEFSGNFTLYTQSSINQFVK